MGWPAHTRRRPHRARHRAVLSCLVHPPGPLAAGAVRAHGGQEACGGPAHLLPHHHLLLPRTYLVSRGQEWPRDQGRARGERQDPVHGRVDRLAPCTDHQLPLPALEVQGAV